MSMPLHITYNVNVKHCKHLGHTTIKFVNYNNAALFSLTYYIRLAIQHLQVTSGPADINIDK